MNAILLVSHGSHSPKTKIEVSQLVETLKKKSLSSILEYAFLEIEVPSIPEGIEICVKKGATAIIILLNFLNSGRHVDEDIPRIIQEMRKKYPHIQFTMTKPITQHRRIIDLFVDMIQECALKKI